MRKPFLLFTLKCSVILYFAACTGIDHYTKEKSATPLVTEGTWKIDLYQDAHSDKTADFTGYTFTFNSAGDLLVNKNNKNIAGNWSEDDIARRITINLGTGDPILQLLNENWNVMQVKEKGILLQGKDGDKLRIAISAVAI